MHANSTSSSIFVGVCENQAIQIGLELSTQVQTAVLFVSILLLGKVFAGHIKYKQCLYVGLRPTDLKKGLSHE